MAMDKIQISSTENTLDDLTKKEAALEKKLKQLKEMEKDISEREKKMKEKEGNKKQVLLRLSGSLWNELASWAEDDFRSINGQIEFLLSESVRNRKKK